MIIKKNTTSLILAIVIGLPGLLKAQDPHFSQFYANPINLNAAFAGTADGNRIVAHHRRQWSRPTQYTTSMLTMDGKLSSAQSGWGVQVMQDNHSGGTFKQLSVNAVLAHRVKLSKTKYLGMGFKLGAYQKYLDWSGLTFEDQFDGRDGIVNATNERFGKDKILNGDVSVGFLYHSDNFFAGITGSHLNRPSEDFTISSNYNLPIKYTAHAGYIFEIIHPGQTQFLSPNIVIEKQGEFQYINLGMYYGNETFSLGGWYRVNDAIIGSIGVNVNEFKIGYSYDVTVSKIANGRNNSHEISLAYLFEFPEKYNRKGRYKGKCPKFYKYLH